MRPIRAGVVGVGKLGARHARLLDRSDAFELVGVHDRSTARATDVAAGLSVTAFADAGALHERVEAVVIAVPTAAHHEAALAAIGAGCHALVEKPLAATLAEADEILALAEARQVVLGVGHVERFNGVLLAADKWLDRPRFIESMRMAPFQPRGSDTTVILDLMIHDIDLVLTLAQAPLEDVHAVGVPVISPRIDLANARLSFEDGTASRSRRPGTCACFSARGISAWTSRAVRDITTGGGTRRRWPRSRAWRRWWSTFHSLRATVNLLPVNSTPLPLPSPDDPADWCRVGPAGRHLRSPSVSPTRSRSSSMSLLKIREERKKLGGAVKRGPRTLVLIVLLALVLMLMVYLGRVS